MKWAIKGLGVVLGAGMAAVEVWGTYGYFLKDQGEFNYIVAVMCGVTLFTALAPMFMVIAWHERRWGPFAFMAVALPTAIAVTFAAAVSRTGGTADNTEASRIHNERVLRLATAAETEAKTAYDDATAAAKTECADGRGKRCDTAEDRQEKAAARLDRARADTTVAQDPKRDPFYSRLKAMTDAAGWHFSEDQIRMYWPIIYPLAMALCAGASLAFGVPHGKPAKPALEPAPRAARRRWNLLSKISQPGGSSEKLVTAPATIKPAESDESDAEPKLSPFRRKPPDLKLVASNPNAGLAGILDFIIEGLESANGSTISEKDVYKAYSRRCKASGAKPVTPEEFVGLLDRACKDCDINRVRKGGKVHLVDVQLIKDAKAS